MPGRHADCLLQQASSSIFSQVGGRATTLPSMAMASLRPDAEPRQAVAHGGQSRARRGPAKSRANAAKGSARGEGATSASRS
eukprot:2582101-Pyramimonas_sp.AAC.1